MKWFPSIVSFLGLTFYCTTAGAVSKAEFDAVLKQADRDKKTKAGWKYMLEFSDKVITNHSKKNGNWGRI